MKDQPFWEKEYARKKVGKKLSPKAKAFAKARAKQAGRPYPNLVDNAAASKKY